LETLYTTFATRVTRVLQPVKDLVDGIASPFKAGTIAGPVGVGVPMPAIAGLSTGSVGGVVVNINGSTIRLEADKVAVLREVIGALLGPEGNRMVDEWFNSQPYGRRR